MSVEYRTIPGFEKYEISEYGVIRVKTTGKKKKLFKKGNSISVVLLDNKNKSINRALQYFVALAWVFNFEGYPYVVRKDRNVDNNHFSNIVWSLSRYAWVTEDGKQCIFCGKFKANSDFNLHKGIIGNRDTMCRPCFKFYKRGTTQFDLKKQQGYKVIPGFSKHAINERGNVVRLKDSKLSTVYNKNNHLSINIRGDNGYIKSLYIKDLVGNIFLLEIGGLNYIYHDSNDKYDISLDNLYRSMSSKVLATHDGRCCSRCNKFLSWDNFSNHLCMLNGKNHICKDCTKKFNNSKIIFNRYNYNLTIEEDPRENENGFLEVRCAFCKGYFEPTHAMVHDRVASLCGLNSGESKLYCSDQCKKNCPVFNKKSNFMWQPNFNKSKYEDARSEEWREMILERDNYICQECGDTENLVAHHIIPVIVDYTISADLDNGVTLCASCHKIKHSEIDGCGNGKLSHLCTDIEQNKKGI